LAVGSLNVTNTEPGYARGAPKGGTLRLDPKLSEVFLAQSRVLRCPPDSEEQAFWAKQRAALIASLGPIALRHMALVGNALLGVDITPKRS
jgi:hypothetical protein